MKKIIILVLFFGLPAIANDLFDDKLLVRFTEDTVGVEAEAIIMDAGMIITNIIPELNLYVGKPEDKFTPEKLIELKANVRVLYVEPNHKIKAYAKPNDPKAWSGDALRLRPAWDISTGSKNVVVAVSDTGVKWSHEDLANHIWTNKGEIDGNGKDDDGNGFIDDVHGWNFYKNTNQSNDDNKHGTHVSGIIGAEGNNGKGLAGVNWSVTIMPVKFLSASGSGSTEGGIQTILYAANNGARIINASWGGDSFNQAMYDSLVYAGSKGVLFFAAAGNSGQNTDSNPNYPSGYKLPNLISVCSAASTNSGSVSSWSNYGRRTTHICAPGLNIMSALNNSNKAYGRLSGTSMATPAVAGIAALILSVHPGLSVLDLKNAVLNAVRGSSLPVATGGLANADMALRQFQGGPQVWPGQFRLAKNGSIQFTAYGFGGGVKWSVDNSTLATIDDTGTLVAKAAGKITVTATGNGEQVASTRNIEILK